LTDGTGDGFGPPGAADIIFSGLIDLAVFRGMLKPFAVPPGRAGNAPAACSKGRKLAAIGFLIDLPADLS